MQFKMFAIRLSIIFCVIGVHCISAWTLRRPISISMVGDVVIETSQEKLVCDKLECPADTERCVVTKQQDTDDTSILIRSSTCYSQTNDVLKELVTQVTIDPGSKINERIEAYRSGAISMRNFSGSSDFDKEKFNKDMEQFHHDLNNEMKHLNKNLRDSNNEFQQNLKSQMEDLNNQLSDMNNQLSHMFDG